MISLVIIVALIMAFIAGVAGLLRWVESREIKDKQGKYIGPEPLPSYYAPEIESGEQ